MNVKSLIEKYYSENRQARQYLITHSELVAEKALAIADACPELPLDKEFVYEAAMLHDIGIVFCHAPAIACYGNEPYIRHGAIGYELLLQNNYPAHARVCLTHVGVGFTAEEVVKAHLPLEPKDMLPESLEEKLVCLADKFYSKTPKYLTSPKPISHIRKQMAGFGVANEQRFIALCKLFHLKLD